MAPFMTPGDQRGHRAVNTTRIIEALIIAAVIGAINLFGTSQAFDERFRYLKEQIGEIKQAVHRIQVDLYRPVYDRRAKDGE